MEMKCGIEIHQRLDTRKLFCSCESIIGDKEIAVVKRRLRAVAGELGTIDAAAAEETRRAKEYVYKTYPRSSCLVELDCEPPHRINEEALDISLEIATLLNCVLVDDVQVMRKTVVDGSNTSGFQRTAIVGLNGWLETSLGRVGIQTVCIEEESAGIDEPGVFSLDRLGIPLVEIATEPSIRDGAHAKEVAEKIGLLLRATGKVQRGIGTIRQDINVSVPGGSRIEIKGAQELTLIPAYVQNEVNRQYSLLKLRERIMERDTEGLLHGAPIRLLDRSKWRLKFPGDVTGMRVPSMRGLIGFEINPNRRFGSELADIARAYGFKGLIHGDEDMGKYGVGDDVKAQLAVSADDSFILIVGDNERAERALFKIRERIAKALEGVPEETRKANADGTSAFMRPLSGGSRLYPETDVPTIRITEARKRRIQNEKSEQLDEKLLRMKSVLGQELSMKMIRSKRLPLYERLVAEGHDPRFTASVLENIAIGIRRKGYDIDSISEAEWCLFFRAFGNGLAAQGSAEEILIGLCENRKEDGVWDIEKIVTKKGLKRITGDELERIFLEERKDTQSIMRKYGKRIDRKEYDGLKRGGA